MKPAKTVAYEVGYKHQLAEDYLLDITFFNKDVSNLVDSNTFLNQTRGETAPLSGLTRYVNMALVNVQGAEIFVKKRPGGILSWDQRHTLVVDLDLRQRGNWGLNLLWRLEQPAALYQRQRTQYRAQQ